MPHNEKGGLPSRPIPIAVVCHDTTESKASTRAMQVFARSLTRSLLGKSYVSDRDLSISRDKVRMVPQSERSITGAGYGIRSWRCPR